MDDQARTIGQRVRYWRTRRNLSRQQFADRVGRSTSWVDKIEKGERNLLRLPMLEQVAGALGVSPSALTDSSAARLAAECVDTVEVAAIRAALGRYRSLAAQSAESCPNTLRQITAQLAYVEHAWSSSHFTVVAQHLPRLLDEAQIMASTDRSADGVTAHRVLVVAYRLASSVLLKFGSHDLAWLAADRAMQTAVAVDDTVALARATRSVARAMSRTGQYEGAHAAIVGMTDRMRPELPGREYELLAPYGMLFLAESIAAARRHDAALALTMHREAQAAANRIGPQHDTHLTSFGAANVAIHRVAALVRLHEADRALDYARSIDPALVSTLPPERRVNYVLDVTQALAETGRQNDAARSLYEAERIASEEVRCRPLAHDLIRSLLDTTSGEAGRLVAQLADRAGLTA